MNDLPERVQLSTSTLSPTATLALHAGFSFDDYLPHPATQWVATRISARITQNYLRPSGRYHALLEPLMNAVSAALRLILVDNFEVPFISTHRLDVIGHDDPITKTTTDILNPDDLWRIGTLGMKFRALMERKRSLTNTYERMNVHDDYFENDITDKLDSIEAVADATEWLGMKYRQAQKDATNTAVDEDGTELKRFKKPTRISAYEIARQTLTSKLADVSLFFVTRLRIIPEGPHHRILASSPRTSFSTSS